MAYVVLGSQVNELQTTVSTSYTPTIYPTDVQNDDLVVAFVEWNAASAVLSCATSGWNIVGTRGSNPTQNAYGQFFYAVVSGGTYSVPTFSSTSSGRAGMVMFVVRDADTSTPIDVALQTNYAIPNPTSGAPTTSTNNCLILHGWAHSGINIPMQPDREKAQLVDSQVNNNSPTALVSFAGQVTAGVVESYTAAAAATTGGGAQWTVAIKNKTGGRPTPDVRYDLDVVSWYGNTAAAVAPLTWYGPEQTGNKFAGGIAGAALGGVTITAGAITTASTVTQTNISTSATNNVIDGAWHPVTLDCTDKIFTVEVQTSRLANYTTSSRIGSLGFLVGFSDGTNYQIFRVKNPARGWLATVDYRVFIACGVTSPLYSSGTLNWASITQVAYFLHHLQTAVDTFAVKNAFLIGGCSLTGGSSGAPTNAAEFARIMLQSRLTGMVSLQSSAQTQIRHSLTIGDGSRPTYFNSEAAAVAFPQAWSAVPVSNWQDEWQVDDGACAVAVKAAATDEISFGASVVSSQTRQTFAFDPTSSGSAAYDFGGCSFVGLDNVWNTDAPCSLATFLRCHQIVANGATFTNCTFKNCASALTAYVTATDGAAFLGCSFVKGLETHAITLTEAGAYDLSETTFSGYTTVLNVAAATGTVTVTLVEGQTEPTYTTAGAAVVFDQPETIATASITNIVPGSRLQVYNVTEDTEMVNTIVAGTSWTASYPNGTGYSTGDVVRVRLAWHSGATAKLPVQYQTIAASGGWAVLADQQDDEIYNLNGIDGDTCTEFSHDFVNVQVDVDDADNTTTVQRGYAWFIAGQMTEDGIRYFFGGITAEDPVNYRINAALVNLRIQNIKAGSNLSVTGGNMYRSDNSDIFAPGASGSTASLSYGRAYTVVVGGGSGLSPEESAKLMSLPSAATVATAVDASTVLAKEATALAAKNNAALAAALSA